MQLLTFLVISIIFWFAGNAILKILFAMVQKDGAIDLLFNWQDKLDRWYGKAAEGSKFHRWLHDALGGCPMCTSFWFMPMWFAVYFVFTKLIMGWFITSYVDNIVAKLFVGWIWFVVFWSVGSILGFFILKIKTKK